MPHYIDREDLDLLLEIDRLAGHGLTQSDIASALRLPLHILRSRVQRHGFALPPAVQLRSIPGGKSLQEMLGAGEIAPAEPVGAADVTA